MSLRLLNLLLCVFQRMLILKIVSHYLLCLVLVSQCSAERADQTVRSVAVVRIVRFRATPISHFLRLPLSS
jgi:hypothetical protein